MRMEYVLLGSRLVSYWTCFIMLGEGIKTQVRD